MPGALTDENTVAKEQDLEIMRYIASRPLSYICEYCHFGGHISVCCPLRAELKYQAHLEGKAGIYDHFIELLRERDYRLAKKAAREAKVDFIFQMGRD